MKTKTLQIISALTITLSVGSVHAADSGFYVGGSIGQGTIELEPISDIEFDETDTAWKVLAGFNFDLPLLDLGIEGGYVDLGAPSVGDSRAMIELEATGFSAFGLAGFGIGPVDLFAKAGFVAWDLEGRLSGTDVPPEFQLTESDSDTDLAYGVGARFNLGKLGIRAEYERFEIADVDAVYMASVGITFSF